MRWFPLQLTTNEGIVPLQVSWVEKLIIASAARVLQKRNCLVGVNEDEEIIWKLTGQDAALNFEPKAEPTKLVVYNSWKYLFPPRPESAISPDTLAFYENMHWIAQGKKNGTNTVIGISPEKEFFVRTRHAYLDQNGVLQGGLHKQWSMTDHIKQELVRLFPEREWFYLCAELMHSKTKTIKDSIYIHDMLVWMSEFLLDSTLDERGKILDERLITNVEAQFHYVCDEKGKVWYAKRFDKGFKDLFWSITDPTIDEGLVLKNPKGKLRSCRTPTENQSWQVKARHPKAGYAF